MLNLNRGINEIIVEYPVIEKFLSLNEINCTECALGTCQLKDIFDIHNFSKEDQKEMLAFMNDLVNDNSLEIKRFIPQTNQQEYNILISRLIEEHKNILELLYTAEYLSNKDGFLVNYLDDYKQIVNYFKEYADMFHHSKEEDLLFKFFEDNEVINTMLSEHVNSRHYYQLLVNEQDEAIIRKLILEYKDLLTNHIDKEDNILFPYLDRLLTPIMIETIDQEIDNYDNSLNDKVTTYLNDFNNRMFSF